MTLKVNAKHHAALTVLIIDSQAAKRGLFEYLGWKAGEKRLETVGVMSEKN